MDALPDRKMLYHSLHALFMVSGWHNHSRHLSHNARHDHRGIAMKILMLHNRYRIRGGEGVSTDATVALLRDAGHTVDLVEEWNDRVTELGMVKTSIRSVWSSEAYHDITERLAEGDYDVMHVQNFFPLHSPSVFHAARAMGVPTVNSLRNFRLLCPQGMLYRDGGVCMDCVGLKAPLPAVRHGCYRDSPAGTAVVGAMAVSHRVAGTWRDAVDVHVTPSRFAASVHVWGGFDPHHIEVVPNFVHPDPTVGTGEGDFVLFAGRLAPEKGIDVLIEAWRTHLSDIPLRIAGTGILEDDVFAIADDLDTVEYVGTLEHPATHQDDGRGHPRRRPHHRHRDVRPRRSRGPCHRHPCRCIQPRRAAGDRRRR